MRIIKTSLPQNLRRVGLATEAAITSRRWKVKTLLAGRSPTSPMKRRLPTSLLGCFQHWILVVWAVMTAWHVRWLGWLVGVGGRLEGKTRKKLEERLEERCLIRRN